jgi:hypothetical protein
MENGNFRLFAANEKRNSKLQFICFKRKRETELCFPWYSKQ